MHFQYDPKRIVSGRAELVKGDILESSIFAHRRIKEFQNHYDLLSYA